MKTFFSHKRSSQVSAHLKVYLFLPLTFLIISTFVTSALADQKKAADLVKDGQKIDLKHSRYVKLYHELQDNYHFSQQELDTLFQGVTINRHVLELMDRQWEAKPYYKYSPLFLTKKNIRKGKKKLDEHKKLLDRIETSLGVDREIVMAIWAIESRYGESQGRYNVFQTLNTLFSAYPRRSTFFRKQLVHLLLLCRENSVDPHSVKGSYAGAFGQTQFIPSSFREYAVSFDGDDKRDVWHSIPDILASIANYLKRFHWKLHAPIYADIGDQLLDKRLVATSLKGRKGRISREIVQQVQKRAIPPVPDGGKLSIIALKRDPKKVGGKRYIAGYPNFQAITAWNHSNKYAMAVTELAEAFRK